jgi:hypothetical protein
MIAQRKLNPAPNQTEWCKPNRLIKKGIHKIEFTDKS